MRRVGGIGENVEGNLLVDGTRIKRIRAGKVNDFNFRVAINIEEAGFLVNGDTGIVANLLPKAGQRVEQRRFAGVRVSHQGDSQRLLQRRKGLCKGSCLEWF